MNADVLYTAHERTEFLIGKPFFDTLMSKPFGLIQYVGAWLSMFLHKPAVGGGMLVGLWALIYVVGVKAFRLKGNASALMLLPVAFLLTSIVDLGYWIYFLPVRGYWFSQSVAYLIMLLLLWTARCTPRQWHLAWYVLAFCLYPVLGWFALLFVLCLALTDRLTWRELTGIIMLVFTASIWRILLYSNVKLEYVLMAGFPRMVNPSDESEILSLPFWMLGAISILVPLCGRYCTKWYVPVLSAAAGIAFTMSMMFQDKNFINEMRMVRSAQESNWEEVLDVYSGAEKPTVSMVMLKNVALMNEGGLFERSFKMGNEVWNTYNPDSVHITFLEIASPVAYYNYGLLNEGFRLAFECGEQAGFSPFYLKMLCQCAYANGEMPLVERYTAMLHGIPYYSDWKPAPVTSTIEELHDSYPNELTGVENSYSYLVSSISAWVDTDNKMAAEQALFYSMVRCDSRRFWNSLRKYVKTHMDEEFPVHAQEAYILYVDKAPEEKRMMLPVQQEVYDRYKDFWAKLENLVRSGMNHNDVPVRMYEEFGDTYWYYNIFGRKIY